MLVRPHELFQRALNMQYALGAFNTSNLEVTQAIVAAAEAQAAPVIVQTSEGALGYAGISVLTGIVKTLANEASVPVVLHLDHGKTFEIVRDAIEAGFTSVMIDASKEDFETNMAVTRKVVDYAHSRGVWVEAEVGAILGAEGAHGLEGKRTPDAMLTEPAQAEQFIEATKVDALAVSVGTIHGAFTGQEYIRFELLAELEQRLAGVPLVLHGASGIADEQITRAAEGAVCKVNIDTEMRQAFLTAAGAYFKEEHDKLDPRDLLGPARDAVQAVVAHKISVLGSQGQAKL